MDKLVKILKSNRKLKKFSKELEISSKIKNNWNKIFGKLAAELKYSFYRGGILQVEVRNYLWVSEITYFKKKILNTLNEIIGKKDKIIDIRIVKAETLNINKVECEKKEKLEKLEEKIKHENQRKKKLGYKPCKKCNNILTDKEICIFCRDSTK